jgi:hypothetical protein
VKAYFDAGGRLFHLTVPDGPEGCPAPYANMLDFDPGANAALIRAIGEAYEAIRYAAGKLYRNSVELPVNPPSVAYAERQQALALVQALKAFNGLNWASLTTAQKSEALRQNGVASNRLMLILGRLLLKEMSGE